MQQKNIYNIFNLYKLRCNYMYHNNILTYALYYMYNCSCNQKKYILYQYLYIKICHFLCLEVHMLFLLMSLFQYEYNKFSYLLY